jgi:hypothetical protein
MSIPYYVERVPLFQALMVQDAATAQEAAALFEGVNSVVVPTNRDCREVVYMGDGIKIAIVKYGEYVVLQDGNTIPAIMSQSEFTSRFKKVG